MNMALAAMPRRGLRLRLKLGFMLAALAAILQSTVSSPHAATAADRPALPHLPPGQSVTLVSAALTVLSTQHYQIMIGLNCSAATCIGEFPKPGAKRRTNITRLSCYVLSANGSVYTSGWTALLNSQGQTLLNQFLPVDFSSTIGDHQLNRAVDFLVTTSQHLEVVLHATSSYVGYCTATGTLETLQ